MYLTNLREHHSVKGRSTGGPEIAVGDIVILKNDLTKRLFWRLAIVQELLTGNDGKVRAAVIKTTDGNSNSRSLRRSIQHLIPIEVRYSKEATPLIEASTQLSTPSTSSSHRRTQA